jgi:lipopolysaccharide cholinephosphotransferase
MEDLSHYNPEGSELRRAQMRMLEILDAFDKICRKHSINYWLACGTLLGARRHKGFIPWDDDLDVVVLQSDFNKLVSILHEELPEDLKLQARGTDKKFWYYYAKIRDTKSRLHDKLRFKYQGIFIDLFPIEPVPSIQFKRIIDAFLFSEIYYKGAKSVYSKIKYAGRMAFLPVIRLLITLVRIYYKYLSRSKQYTYAFGTFYYSKYNMEYFYPVSEIMFEGKNYKAPSNIDKYLVDNFDANFMVIPKPSDRKTHSSKIEFF